MSGIVWHIDYGFVKLFWFCYSDNTTKVFLKKYFMERERERERESDIVRGGREGEREGWVDYIIV